MDGLIGQLAFALLNGIVSGLILALLGLGLGLILNNLKTLNLAHGAFYMLGAMIGWQVQAIASFWAAVIIAPVSVGALGALTERFVLRPIKQAHLTLVCGIAIMLVIQALAVELWGSTTRAVDLPIQGTFELFGSRISYYRIFVGSASLLIFVLVWGFLRLTRLGLWIRAVGQDRELALSQGIPVPNVWTFTFGLGVAIAAIAGLLISPLIGVLPSMGEEILILALIIVIVGASTWGILGISIFVSIADNLWPVISQSTFGAVLYPTLAKGIIILILVGIVFLQAHRERATR